MRQMVLPKDNLNNRPLSIAKSNQATYSWTAMEFPAEKPLEIKKKFIFTRAHPFYKLTPTVCSLITKVVGGSMTGVHLLAKAARCTCN